MEDDFSLRSCAAEDDQASGWVVTGPSKNGGRRWRRFFVSKEQAQAFLAEQQNAQSPKPKLEARDLQTEASEVKPRRRRRSSERSKTDRAVARAKPKEKHHKRRDREETFAFTLPRFVGMILLIGAASLIDHGLRHFGGTRSNEQLLTAHFETNPLLSGWITSGKSTDWTNSESCSGTRSILIQHGSWSSPLISYTPQEWYRVEFQSKAPKTPANPGSAGYGYFSVTFYDATGRERLSECRSSVFQSADWATTGMRVRGLLVKDSQGRNLPGRMRVSFTPIGEQPFFVDDVSVEKTTGEEVLEWADAIYRQLPARPEYKPKASRWQRIPRTIAKLERGEPVRIAMLGGAGQRELANSPVELLLKRSYPKCAIELVSQAESEGGARFFKERAAGYAARYKPDLIIIGDIENRGTLQDVRQFVEQIRRTDMQAHRSAEIMLLTNGWSPNAIPPDSFALSLAIREIDQSLEGNKAIPNNFRGLLWKFAAESGIEYLDMTGIVSEFIFGPAQAAGEGPPADAEGNPYSYWMRDSANPNDRARQITCRILEAYFAPDRAKNTEPAVSSPKLFGADKQDFDAGMTAAARGTQGEAMAEFDRGSTETTLLGESFFESSRLALSGMVVKDGVAFSASNEPGARANYTFEKPVDIRDSDMLVYWAFRSNSEALADVGKLEMNLTFASSSEPGEKEPARISLEVRPRAACTLQLQAGTERKAAKEMIIDAPGKTFGTIAVVEKFRLIVRLLGTDRVIVEPFWWDRRKEAWEPFIVHDAADKTPAIMELGLKKDFPGGHAVESVEFQPFSSEAKLDTVVVTTRPGGRR